MYHRSHNQGLEGLNTHWRKTTCKSALQGQDQPLPPHIDTRAINKHPWYPEVSPPRLFIRSSSGRPVADEGVFLT